VYLSGWVGVGFGGNCDCRCGILYNMELLAPIGHSFMKFDLRLFLEKKSPKFKFR